MRTRGPLPLTEGVVAGLVSIAQESAAPEVCYHLVVYRGSEILLAAYDAGSSHVAISRGLPPDVTERVKVVLHGDRLDEARASRS